MGSETGKHRAWLQNPGGVPLTVVPTPLYNLLVVLALTVRNTDSTLFRAVTPPYLLDQNS